jgi:thiol-disulfide isomerase/thioredoxin
MVEPGSDDQERRELGEEKPAEPPVARLGARYSAIVGVLFIVFLIIVGVNTLGGDDEGGILGVNETPVGDPVPRFAIPVATGPVEGDANVVQRDCAVAERPCPPEYRQTLACEVKGPGIIRVCDLFDRPLVISFWFTRGGDCEAQQDVVDAVAERYRGRVNFLSLNVRDERATVRRLIEERGWRIRVGHDADGAVANLYRVGGCPTFAYVDQDGDLAKATIGQLDQRQLSMNVDELIRKSR